MRKLFYILSFVFACCVSQGAKAGHDIFYIDWDVLPLDSVMPCYTEVIPLESDYREHDYRVRLLYPEWKEMSKSESLRMMKWEESVSYDLNIRTFVGVSRGKGMLDVTFLPVVKRDGKFLKLLSAKMEIEAVEKQGSMRRFVSANARGGVSSASSLAERQKKSERYTRKSKLSEGKWVKISIKEDGMYRLTRSALLKMGFKNPDNVHLYGHGGYRLSEVSNPEDEYDDLQEVALYQSNKDTWLFWGNGLVYWDGDTRIFNPYARASYYFLTEEDAPSKMEVVDYSQGVEGAFVDSFTDHLLYEKDEYGYGQLGRNLFESANFSSVGSRTYKLTTPANSVSNERLTIAFTAGASTMTKMSAQVNGQSVGGFDLGSTVQYVCGTSNSKTFDVSSCKTGKEWTVKISSTQGNEAHLDYLALHYSRAINPGDSYVAFDNQDFVGKPVCVSGMNEWTEVMQIGTPGTPCRLVKGVLSDNKLKFRPVSLSGEGSAVGFAEKGKAERFVCFNINYSYPQPTVVGSVSNQNLHALDSLDMVIIIPQSGKLWAEAERLAQAHRIIDGLRVAVVRADEIYNEFSSGTPDATAYRRLMKMLYDRADGDEKVMPRYLLLFGDCSFDNRMLTQSMSRCKPEDYLLCFESENSFSDTKSYVMEDYFGLLDDGEGGNLVHEKSDLGIGRFPVSTATDAKVMVDKVIDYISNRNAGAWKNVVMMLGDDGDNNSHMTYCDRVAENIIEHNPELEVKKVMWDAFTRVSTLSSNTYPEVTALMKKQLEDGVMVMNYTGHGAPYVLSHEAVWNLSNFEEFKGSRLPLWFTAACDVMPFDGTKENLGKQAVLNEGGGALAFVGTTRTVYASNNASLNDDFSEQLFAHDENGRRLRLGDALRTAKMLQIGTERVNYENKLQYALLGDPALIIGAPLNRVRLDAITDVTTNKAVEVIRAGMPIRLSGSLLDENGAEMNDFNGVVTARIYDAKDTITCNMNDNTLSEPFVYTDRSSVLYTGQDSVRNGKFELYCVVPKDIKYSNGAGRVVLYAINDSLDVEANGYYEDFLVGGAFDTDDTEGPEILLALNGEPGGVVNSTPYLSAVLSDENGINVTGNGIGHDIVLSVDDNPDWTYVLNDYYVPEFGNYKQGSLGFVIPKLPAGAHTLSLRAWDLLNNSSVSMLDFTVDPNFEPSIVHLVASPNPAVTHTNFFVTCDLPGSDIKAMVEVFDFSGRRLWMSEGHANSITGAFVVPWNLSVGGGYGRISPGVYLYRASIRCEDTKWVSKTQKLIVR